MQDGIIVPVFDKMRLEYSYLAPGVTETITLARDINVSPFYRVQLIIRVHAITMASAGQNFAFTLNNTLPSEVDPREFSDPTAFLAVSFTFGTLPTPPAIKSGVATDPGAFLKLTATATQQTGGSTALYGEFSGVLVLRRP